MAAVLIARHRNHDSTQCLFPHPLQVSQTVTHSLQYVLAVAACGLCDDPLPSHITVLSQLELIEAYKEAWHTFSWSEHLMLDLPPLHEAPYVSGGALVLPI